MTDPLLIVDYSQYKQHRRLTTVACSYCCTTSVSGLYFL